MMAKYVPYSEYVSNSDTSEDSEDNIGKNNIQITFNVLFLFLLNIVSYVYFSTLTINCYRLS